MLRAALVLLIILLLYLGTFTKRGYLDWRRMLEQNQNLNAKIEETERHRASIERQIQALKTDTAEQERLVREVLGYVKPNEYVIEFD